MTKTCAWAAVCSALLLPGCDGVPAEAIVSCEGDVSLPPQVSTDILFVIDNSLSMAEEQTKVVNELSAFVESLVSGPVDNDFQVGVTTTSVTANSQNCSGSEQTLTPYPEESGLLQQGKDIDGLVIDSTSNRILHASDPDFLSEFATLIGQGINGSFQEMGLEAMRLALSDPLTQQEPGATPAGNAGFLRPGARLLVVIVSDEDDCSDPTGDAIALQFSFCGSTCSNDGQCGADEFCAPLLTSPGRRCQFKACDSDAGHAALEPVSTYTDFLKNLDDGTGLGRKRSTYLAMIAPVDPADTSVAQRCAAGGTEAFGTGHRYLEAANLMGSSAVIDSICQDSYGTTLETAAGLVNVPQTLDLPNSPPDPRLLNVQVLRDGQTIQCILNEDFRFDGPRLGHPGRITMQNKCRLQGGDDISIKLYCAG